MKKRNSFAFLSLAGVAILGLASCDKGNEPSPEPGPEEHQHVFSELHEKVEPTCLTEGREAYYTCDGCDKIFNESKEEVEEIASIPTIDHVPHHHEAVAPGCETTGLGEYWTCDNEVDEKLYGDANCSEVIAEIPVVEAKGHSVELQPGQAASCTATGWKEYYKCKNCNALFEDEAETKPIPDLETWKNGAGMIQMTEHIYGNVEVEWNGSSATAQAKCQNCPHTISETKEATFVEDQAETCHSAQLGHYEVTFNDTRLGSASTASGATEGKPATGKHTYGTPEYTWNESTHEATAKAKCTATGCDDEIQETKAASFVEDRAVSCFQDQLGHYEVSFNDTRLGSYATEANSATGTKATGNHTFDYANKTVSWSGNAATATAKCTTPGCTESISETKTAEYVKDSAQTCTSAEKGHKKVTFDNTSFGVVETEAGSIEVGEPHDHTLGDLIPQVEPQRQTAGMKAHYRCSECQGYFDTDKKATTEDDLAIAVREKHFLPSTDLSFDFDEPIALTETIYIDVKLVNPTSSSKVNFALLGLKDDGGTDWDHYLGYFAVRKDSVDNYDGVSLQTITDDGYFRLKIDLSKITRFNNTNGQTPTISAINGLFVRGAWTDVEGYIEINSACVGHKYGSLIQGNPETHTADGVASHYVCSECSKIFDANLNEISSITSNTKHSFVTGSTNQVNFRAELNEIISFDIKFTSGSNQWFYLFDKDAGDAYRYIGFKICSDGSTTYENNGNFAKPTDPDTLYTIFLADGWLRTYIDLSKLTVGASVSGVNFLRTHASWGDGSGTIMINHDYDYGYAPLNLEQWKLQRIVPVKIAQGNSIRVRVNFTNIGSGSDSNLHICLSTNANASDGNIVGFGNFKIINKGNGTVVLGDTYNGVSIERVEDYVYDVIFDLASLTNHTKASAPADGASVNAITIYNWLQTTGTICYIPESH